MAWQIYPFLLVLLLTCIQNSSVFAIPARHHYDRLNPGLTDLTISAATSSLALDKNDTSDAFDYLLIPATDLFTKSQTVNFTATITQYPPTTTIIISTDLLGRVHTALETQGHPSRQPFPILSTPAVVTLATAFSPISTRLADKSHTSYEVGIQASNETHSERTASTTLPGPTVTKRASSIWRTKKHTQKRHDRHHHHHHHHHHQRQPVMDKRASTDCFQPVASGPVPQQIAQKGGHPVARLGIAPQNSAVSTNKFYANLFLGNQDQGVWTHPYSLAWSKGGGSLKSWGMAISHIDANQKASGPQNHAIPGSPVQYFINPVGIQSIILSAIELGPSTKLTTNMLGAMSANAVLAPQAGSPSHITFPLVQGMGFVSALYMNLMPSIQSAVIFRTMTQVGSPRPGIYKYRLVLEDGKTWLLYAISSDGQAPNLKLVSSTQIQGTRGWTGMIQVAKNPQGAEGETSYDSSAGVYASHAAVSASVSGSTGMYDIRWTKSGLMRGQSLLMYALPHHVRSFSGDTASRKTTLQLQTTTKGLGTAVIADTWTLVQSSLPTDLGFAPWTPSAHSKIAISSHAQALIQQVATSEINQDIDGQTNLDSMYFSGKALSKFATLIYTMHDMLNQKEAAMKALTRLQAAFARFVSNKQQFPLVYDTVWKGVVSSSGYSGDLNQDFGNTAYNDHHFHYGYFIHAGAIIAYLDPSWLTTGTNKAWVNTLVRDAGNPSTGDALFPFSRAFDWYHGHSWAKGLFESADSKDEESTSEDAMFAYALKMWGKSTGDASMEARGSLMLGILAHTFDEYFLMTSQNQNQPSNFIANKVTGILFDNKADHTTYFGTNPEYIQGIHMLPLLPSSAYTRSPTFITEEWSAYFANSAFNPADKVSGGWRGILYGNLACVDPKSAWAFFSQTGFDSAWIDGGASRTWYLAFSAALGGL